MKRARRRSRRHAFTLLEVLLVLAILVILGATVTVVISRTQDRANTRAAEVQISALAQRLDQYRIDMGAYPNTAQGLNALVTPPSDLASPDKWFGPYVDKTIPPDPWSNPYQYELATPDQFRIWSWGRDGQDGTGDEISNL